MGQRLLIVESDRRFVGEHKVALESAFDVDFSFGTDGVIQRLEDGTYAAVLICVEVNENKGYALCSAIRKVPGLSDLKIGLISAKATEEEYARHQSLKGKADLYLHKPITSGAFIAALGALAPPKTLNPDNPFGDLMGDIGEEWLDTVKAPALTVPDLPLSPPPPPSPPVAPAHASTTSPLAEAKAAEALEALHAKIRDLEAQLRQASSQLTDNAKTIEGLRQEQHVATVNMDETERLRTQLHESLEIQKRQASDIEDMKAHLTDKAGEAAELARKRGELEERTVALAQSLETLQNVDAELRQERDRVAGLQAEQQGHMGRIQDLETHVARLEERAAAQADRAKDLERVAAEHANTLKVVEEKDAKLQTLSQELEAKRTELDALNVDAQGLEATLRGQRRELAEQGSRLGALTRECESQKERTLKAEGQLAELEATVADKQAALRAAEEAHEQTRSRLQATCDELDSQLAKAVSDLERQKLELLQALDDREGKITHLQGELAAQAKSQQTRIDALEQEKRGLDGQLNEKTARMESLSEALKDLENGIRRASDLTRPL